jgi:hypothetical protein
VKDTEQREPDGEQLLRKMLWLSHGCPVTALYGDDGEMFCGACVIDFKRWAARDIEGRLAHFARIRATTPSTPTQEAP